MSSLHFPVKLSFMCSDQNRCMWMKDRRTVEPRKCVCRPVSARFRKQNWKLLSKKSPEKRPSSWKVWKTLIQICALSTGFPTTIQSSGLRYCVHRLNFKLQRNCVACFQHWWCLQPHLSSTPSGSNNLISWHTVSCDTTYPLWIASRCKHWYFCICQLQAISAYTN